MRNFFKALKEIFSLVAEDIESYDDPDINHRREIAILILVVVLIVVPLLFFFL